MGVSLTSEGRETLNMSFHFTDCVRVSLQRLSRQLRLEGEKADLSLLSNNRNLPHRLAETDRRAVRPRRVPGKQRGGHQRATHHRRPEGEQTAVLSEPVTHGKTSLLTWVDYELKSTVSVCFHPAWGAIVSEICTF